MGEISFRLRIARSGVDAGDDIAAPANLRVLDAKPRQTLAGAKVDQKSRDIGRSKIDSKTQRLAARGDRVDHKPVADPQFRAPVVDAEQVRQRARRRRRDIEIAQNIVVVGDGIGQRRRGC